VGGVSLLAIGVPNRRAGAGSGEGLKSLYFGVFGELTGQERIIFADKQVK
jgi:hypothetical protein